MSDFQQKLLTVLIFLAASTTTSADRRPVEGASCAEIDNDIARLQCYDEVYSDYRNSASSSGNWDIQTTRDPLDDIVTTYLVVEANERSKIARSFSSNQLIIRCMGDELDLYIKWGEVIGGSVSLNVTHRVGDSKAQTQTWLSSTSGTSTFYPGSSITLVRKMMETDRFVARIPHKSFQADDMTAIFDTSGLKNAATPLRKTCLPPPPDLSNDPHERLIQQLQQKMRSN